MRLAGLRGRGSNVAIATNRSAAVLSAGTVEADVTGRTAAPDQAFGGRDSHDGADGEDGKDDAGDELHFDGLFGGFVKNFLTKEFLLDVWLVGLES